MIRPQVRDSAATSSGVSPGVVGRSSAEGMRPSLIATIVRMLDGRGGWLLSLYGPAARAKLLRPVLAEAGPGAIALAPEPAPGASVGAVLAVARAMGVECVRVPRDPCVGPPALAAEAWRPLIETVRCAGRRMANRGEILVRQGGRTIDPQDFRGPVRFARGPRFDGGVGA